jgi:hypothetical protein
VKTVIYYIRLLGQANCITFLHIAIDEIRDHVDERCGMEFYYSIRSYVNTCYDAMMLGDLFPPLLFPSVSIFLEDVHSSTYLSCPHSSLANRP